MKRLGIIVVVLLALLLAADRGGAWVAGRLAGEALQASQDLPQRPDVTVRGFPFLTQLARQRFGEVEVRSTDIPLGGTGVRLTSVDVDLRQVERLGEQVSARTARAVALIDYDDLAAALGDGVRLTYLPGQSEEDDGTDGGRLGVEVGLPPPLGVTVTGTVGAELRDDVLVLDGLRLDDGGDSAVLAAAQDLVALRLPLANVPFSVRVEELALTEQGVRLVLRGRDLRYRVPGLAGS